VVNIEPMDQVAWCALGHDLSVVSAPCARAVAPVLMLRGVGLAPDWAFYPHLVARLAEQRPVWLLPDSVAPSLVAELDLVETMLRAWAQGLRPPGFEGARGAMGLIGHGKGATLALLAGALGLGVQGVIGLAPWATFHRGAPGETAEELAAHAHRFFVERAARSIEVPMLLVHGEEDHVVSPAEAELVYHWLPKETGRLIMLEKTGHSFGARHPFVATTKELEIVVRVACDFFR
jgi:pimeloyl-ACP methyl ester carboxylesterase